MRRLLLFLFLMLATVGSSAAQTADEIMSWYDGYAKLWRNPNTFDVDAVAGYFASPRYNVGPDGVAQLVTTKETSRSNIAAFVERLKERPGGWARSEGRAIGVQMLNSGAALIETEWTSYTTDGNPFGMSNPSRHILSRQDQGRVEVPQHSHWPVQGSPPRGRALASGQA